MSAPANLPLRQRRIDIFFAIVFAAFTVTSLISDLLPTVGVNFSHPSGNFFVNSNYWYAHDTDVLFMHPPDWMRIVTGLSAFVYMPFYVVLVVCLLLGKNWIQLFAVIYATMIVTLTGIVVFGVEFFGDPATRTGNPAKFLAFNLPYVLVPLILLIRMRKPLPFTRRF
ncbi:EXPERA domain-containing protein [Nocardia alni]|uniref:EXPERA domain-containing protein n=1 Tax=Nocardia alni TaxID=2815723 RepID=UPI001C23EAC1|nr:emopamil-binding family protein [Nocardia alni]